MMMMIVTLSVVKICEGVDAFPHKEKSPKLPLCHVDIKKQTKKSKIEDNNFITYWTTNFKKTI